MGSLTLEQDVDRAEAERLVHEASIADLKDWLEAAARVSETGSAVSRVPQPMG